MPRSSRNVSRDDGIRGEPRISWTKNQRGRLNSAVRKYNNAIRREMRANPQNEQFLPDLVKYSDLKASINSARTLNNTVNRLLRVTRPGALNLARVGDGGITTRYEVREFQILKAVNERRKSIRRKKLGIDFGQTLGRMGTLQQNNLLPDKRTVKDFSPIGLRRFIQRQEELMAQSSIDKIRLYYRNYIKGLDTEFGGYSIYDERISNISEKIRSMIQTDPKRLLDFFESGDEILSIEFIYGHEERDDRLMYIEDRWAQL